MWEFFQYVMGLICILLGLGGAACAIGFSQDGARTSEFGFAIMVAGIAWAGGLAYMAFRLFGFQ